MCFQNPIPIVFKCITFVFWVVGCLCEHVVSVNLSLCIGLSCSLSCVFLVLFFVYHSLSPLQWLGSGCFVQFLHVQACVGRWSLSASFFGALRHFWSLPHCMMRCLNPETKHTAAVLTVWGRRGNKMNGSIIVYNVYIMMA